MVKIKRALFSVGNEALLINLKEVDHRNNEPFALLLPLLFSLLVPLKVNLPLSQTHARLPGKKTKKKNLSLIRIKAYTKEYVSVVS